MPTRITVVHYSATGNVTRLARAIAEGAADAGAEVRLRRVEETAPDATVAANAVWSAHRAELEGPDGIAVAELDDLAWADGIALGAPTRFGLPAAQLKQFIDQTGGLWAAGTFAQKVVTGFTSGSTAHGGLESTVLALLNTAYHWGAVVLPLGYTDPVVFRTGNPYGATWVARSGSAPDDDALAAARHQGRRLATVAGAVAATVDHHG